MKNIILFLKYSIINGGLTGVYFLLYYVFIEYININYVLSNLISYVVTVLTAYYLTKVFVFASTKDEKITFFLFVIVRIVIVGVSSIGLWFCINLLDLGKYVAFIIVNLACFISSYLLNKLIFTEKRING